MYSLCYINNIYIYIYMYNKYIIIYNTFLYIKFIYNLNYKFNWYFQ